MYCHNLVNKQSQYAYCPISHDQCQRTNEIWTSNMYNITKKNICWKTYAENEAGEQLVAELFLFFKEGFT